MEKIEFSKLNGQGNDFILIDATSKKLSLSDKKVVEMCDRNFGIGADGLILIKKSDIAELKMEIYNSDGSIAEMCGNGIRCLARFAMEKGIIKNKRIKVETAAGTKEIFIDIRNKKAGKIKVNMGIPEFTPEKVPVIIKNNDNALNYKITVESKDFYINCVSMGNPHCVIFLEDNDSLKNYPVSRWGPLIENHAIFPEKTNVEFIKIRNKGMLDMRVWERGVGETLACGTGACAAAVCAIKLGKVSKNNIDISLPGGISNVFWDNADLNVYLEGEVNYKFDGVYFL
jgi:diaminopimelate epimerase